MSLRTLTAVHATHDLRRGRTLVRRGRPGRVVGSFPNWSSTTYSVEFITDEDPTVIVIFSGLTERDLQPTIPTQTPR